MKWFSHKKSPVQKDAKSTTVTCDKDKLFVAIWLLRHIHRNESVLKCLDDDAYLEYHVWEKDNAYTLHNEYLHGEAYRGVNSHIIFHGGCLGCISQQLHGVDRCKGCLCFRSVTSGKPDLKIEYDPKYIKPHTV